VMNGRVISVAFNPDLEALYQVKPGIHEGTPQSGAENLSADAQQGVVGRNSPCPCGSGKKYKRCHGR